MNASNDSIVKTWKRLKGHYVVTACGLALAVSVAVAVGGWQSDSASPVPARAVVSTQSPIPAAPARYVFYLVGSEEQRQSIIERAMDEDFPGEFARIFVIHSQDDELVVFRSQSQLTQLDQTVEVVDLRSR